MKNENTNDRDNDRLAALLRTTDANSLPPNRAILDNLRQQSADVFMENTRNAGDVSPDVATPSDSAPDQQEGRSHKMSIILRSIVAVAAAVAGLAVWLGNLPSNSVRGAVPFSEILNELRGAQTLELRVVKEGRTANVWVRAPGLVRWEESPTRYEITAGSRLWKIDESTNTITEGDSPWFLSPERQVDLLGLLDLGVHDSSPLLAARALDRVVHDGRDCFVYRVALPAEQGRMQVEAFVDATNKQLVSIFAWPADTPRGGNTPLAELTLLATNTSVADDKFTVARSLTEDGRIGKVNNSQGVVVLRPMLAKRWTPICRETLLKPGDWLRTDLRGANAVKVLLSSQVELTLGPGTLVECISPSSARLHTGQVQVTVPKQDGNDQSLTFDLLAPRNGRSQFKSGAKQLVRVDPDESLIDVAQTPVWLAGFEGTTANESLGSLIVNLPDGRNEPLTVGYHKVNVEIRDQIARTTIEESFINHTDARLEGVFHFPLPQEASISGFGMWIGNDLIEADVVEKQRAREIYETILRERRDPGLLEWTGGNIFKARVFPIEARSDKRIKIVYTQVLPLRANRYRYSYGLRSELLRTKPLSELSLSVTVNSALPLKNVTCPTHSARIQQTQHSAQLEFAAQEYTPTRDFEAVFEIDGRQSDVIVVPHRRGDDGYLLVQLTPPSAEGNWQRELLPDGRPLRIVLLCDTSASMDSEKRKQQAEFVATVLSSLGPDDRFHLVACDVDTAWAPLQEKKGPSPQPSPHEDVGRGSKAPELVAATAEAIDAARRFLDERLSLGWTNLDRAFSDVLQKAPPDAQVIYIGDGIVSAGETDPAAFVKRLEMLVNQAAAPLAEPSVSGGRQPPGGSSKSNESDELERTNHRGADAPRSPRLRCTLHAVTVGNSYESVVLSGIASTGGGSVRAIGGELTAQMVALELLNEVAQPGLRDLNVEFRGLKIAAMYPGRLPNIPAGTQQILVGRYLPEGKDQQGEIIVTGVRGTEKVRYAARISLKDAEEGNSFIPRLWARSHLDYLLAQGQATPVRDEIIALSEQFHIITPYTSLLVLETDADRERFGVQRRYEMRDGERFFAQGRNNANYELLQQQMKRAGNWRLGLRRQVLRGLMNLGRDPRVFQSRTLSALQGRIRSLEQVTVLGDDTNWFKMPAGMGGRAAGNWANPSPDFGSFEFSDDYSAMFDGVGDGYVRNGAPGVNEDDVLADSLRLVDVMGEISGGEEFSGLTSPEPGYMSEDVKYFVWKPEFDEVGERGDEVYDAEPRFSLARSTHERGAEIDGLGFVAESSAVYSHSLLRDSYGNGRYSLAPNYTSWLNTLFPPLAGRPSKSDAAKKDPETWSPEAIELSKSLLRTESMFNLDGGIELRRVTESFDPTWNRRSSHNSDLALYSPSAWLTRPLDPNDHTIVNYCNTKERGVYSLAFLLGRVRSSVDQELKTPPLALDDFSLLPLHDSYRSYSARVQPAEENRLKLVLTTKYSTHEEHFTVDTARHVLVKRETFEDGQQASATRYEDFVEVAGRWWATKSTKTDEKGRKVSETKREIKTLAANEYEQRMAAELEARHSVQFVHLPFVKLSVARQKVADGSAGFDDRLAMILHNAMIQQWDELWKHVDAAEKLSTDAEKPGVRWMRTTIFATIRRNEEARQRFLEEARQLAANRQQDDLILSEFVLNQAYGLMGWSEFLELVQVLKPVYERQPEELDVMAQWQERLAQCYDALGRNEDSLAIRRANAEAAPWRLDWQIDYARRLTVAGKPDAALAWLKKETERSIERNSSELESLNTAVADVYRGRAQWENLLKFTTNWVAQKPKSQSAYSQHLSALVYNDQLSTANSLADQWLKEARVEGKFTEDQRARFESALSFATGSAYYLSFHRMDERWFEPIADTIRFFLRHKHHGDIAIREIGNSRFNQSDAADKLRGEFLQVLEASSDNLTPRQISTLVAWTISGRIELKERIAGRKQLDAAEVPSNVWQRIATVVRARWAQAPDKDEKNVFGDSLRTIYSTRFKDTDLLPFLRERFGKAHPDYKMTYARELFDALLVAKWSEEIEQEAFALLRELSGVENLSDRLIIQIPALYGLVDAMLANRQALADQELGDEGEQNKLTRKELAARKSENRKAARIGVTARLHSESAKEQGPFEAWLKIEQTWLDMQLDQNIAQVDELCWQILGEAPQKPEPVANANDDGAESQARQQFLDALLKQRAFTTVMSLATRKSADPAIVARLLKYVDAGIALGNEMAPTWRNLKFNILVALDRPDDLERELREWIRADVSTSPWRQMLARLVAERGKLDEAIQLFESTEKDKLLSAADYSMLADWYAVSNQRQAYERARIEAFKQTPERQLLNSFYQVRNRWMRQDQPLPSELDESTLFALRALFEKSGSPENYLSHLRDLYAACRDFRLLQVLPDAVLGRSPQQVYSFLQNLEQVLTELRNEATADEIIARIRKLREADRTATDLRALDLMEAVVERKSSEVLNQPGPHIDACLAALQRGFQRTWLDGEPVQMGNFLYRLGTLHHPKLVEEQIREIRELQKMAPVASRDHLLITNDLSNLLFYSYGRKDEAIRELEVESRSYAQAHNDAWPHQDNNVLGSYVSLYERADRHTAGERVLQRYLAKPEHDEQRKWLIDRLMELYNDALEHNSAVSIGENRAKLFQSLMRQGLEQLDAAPDESQRYNLVARLTTTMGIAHRHKIAGAADAIRKFAFQTIPIVLKRQQGQYRNTVTAPMQIIRETLGPKLALQYVVERIEQYPDRLEIQWENSWNTLGYQLAQWRQEASNAKLDIRDLEPRILKLAIRQLERELRTGESGNNYVYHVQSGYFWQEKAAEFARAAESVLAEHKTSGRLVMKVATYLHDGLHLQPRAIEILLVAHKNGLLEESSQNQLAHWLQEAGRYAEMIPILEPLVAARPESIDYRTRLMIAYHHSQRPEQLANFMQQTDEFFHQAGRWIEGNVAHFARGCFDCSQWDRAISYFNEAIALRQRGDTGQRYDDSTLSDFYRHVALAQSALGRTREAVDAASASIVCWSMRHEQRSQSLNLLKQVVSAAKDLDDYVQRLDEDAAKSGQDSAILRKAIGQSYQSLNDHAKAITQLQIAVQLQPNDQETHEALIASYDAVQNRAAGSKQLVKLIDLKRHDLALYQQLAERLKNDEHEAERAATSIIESSPNEAETHAAMAELRQKQNRWDEAISHWEQVAQLRRLEPNGLLKLAEAQIHQKQWDAARESIHMLQKTTWPSRFSDVENQSRQLLQKLPK